MNLRSYLYIATGLLVLNSCDQMLEVQYPHHVADAGKVFEDNELAEDAVASIYRTLDIHNGLSHFWGCMPMSIPPCHHWSNTRST